MVVEAVSGGGWGWDCLGLSLGRARLREVWAGSWCVGFGGCAKRVLVTLFCGWGFGCVSGKE